MKKILGLLFLILVFVFSPFLKARANNIDIDLNLNLDYPSFQGISITEDQDLNQVIAWGYYFIVAISGFSAFFMFVWGGFEWASSVGDPNKISAAKEKIESAAIGLLIVLSAYLILQVINPDLTTLQLPRIAD